MTKEEIFKEIVDFEYGMGEGFNDRFSHDTILTTSWAFYLLGKGFTKHAHKIIEVFLEDSDRYVDQETLFDIKTLDDVSREETRENWDFNMKILAEFLSLTPVYTNRFKEFIKNNKK